MYPDLSNRIIDPPVARIAFSKIKGINFSTASRLLGMLGSPEQFFTMQPAALQASCGIDRRICDTGYRQSLLDAAEQDGRIDATTRPIYENLLANDRENGEKALAQLPVKRRVMEDLHLEPNGEESPWNRRMREIKDKRKK